MQPRRILIPFVATVGLGCLSLLSGCGDDSRTTGTQLQLTPKDKAEIEGMRGTMKEQRAELKQERAELRKKRK